MFDVYESPEGWNIDGSEDEYAPFATEQEARAKATELWEAQEPSDYQLANRYGMEGGIAYNTDQDWRHLK